MVMVIRVMLHSFACTLGFTWRSAYIPMKVHSSAIHQTHCIKRGTMSSETIAENSKDVFTDGNQLFNKFKRTYQIVNNMRFGGVHSGAATSDQWHKWLLDGCWFIPSVLVASPMRNVWRYD